MLRKPLFRNQSYVRQQSPLFLVSVLLGIVGGLGAIAFRLLIAGNHHIFFGKILGLISLQAGGLNLGIILLPALGGLIVGLLVDRWAPEARGHGVPEVMEAVHFRGGVIRPVVAAVKIFASSVTIGSGGSAGREGPIAQIGAVFGSVMGRFFLKDRRRVRLMVAAGLGAGISATFHAPLGGAVFAMEVIATRTGLFNAIPILIAAVVGDIVMCSLYGWSPQFNIPPYTFVSVSEVPIFAVLGVVFGLLAYGWFRAFYAVERRFDAWEFPDRYKPALGGLAVGVIGMFLVNYEVMGVGYGDIDQVTIGQYSLGVILLLGVAKIVATSLTVGSGGSGGIFAPSLYIGSMFGAAAGIITHGLFPDIVLQPNAYALVGMGAIFAGACRAPITCLVMIPEMTNNYYLFVPMAIVCSLSYFTFSLFSSSSLYMRKLENRGLVIRHKANLLENILVKQVMETHVSTVHPDKRVDELIDLMLEVHHPGFPVVDPDTQEYLGYVPIYGIGDIPPEERKERRVFELTDRDYLTISPEDDVYKALHMMNEEHVGRLMVVENVDGKRRLRGIISKTDVIKAYDYLIG